MLSCGKDAQTTLYFGDNLTSLPHIFACNETGSTTVYSTDRNYYINKCVILGNTVAIPNYTFANLSYTSYLNEITIPDSVTTIGDRAFYGCEYISELSIPDTVTTIGTEAFYNVPHITYNGTAEGSPWGALSIN